MTGSDDLGLLLKALRFSAEKHRDQRRKDRNASPYINHPIQVAHVLWEIGQVRDVITLSGALLHDTLEDTNATAEEIRQLCGEEVLALVQEVTDDKKLSKVQRKRQQIEQAPHKSKRAKELKLADKICNVSDIAHSPPQHWSTKRRQEYLQWSEQVIAGLRGVNPLLEHYYDQVLNTANQCLIKESAPHRCFQVDDRVKHPRKPHWGVGRILYLDEQHVRVFFVYAGQKLLKLEKTALSRLDSLQTNHLLLDNLLITKQRVYHFKPINALIETFLHKYPDGFYSTNYLAYHRRNYHLAHQNFQQYFSQIKQLLEQQAYEEIIQKLLTILHQFAITEVVECCLLEQGLQSIESKQLFVETFYQLVWGEDVFENRFSAFVACLLRFKAANWRIISGILFIANPTMDILITPETTLKTTEYCAFDLQYQTQPNWQTYQQALKFIHYLSNQLNDMRPRDMIDIYGFISVIAKHKFEDSDII